MFDNLVQSAVFPAILEVLEAAEKSLVGVKSRLVSQTASPDSVTVILARSQLEILAAWEPALAELRMNIDRSHERVHGSPTPSRRDR